MSNIAEVIAIENDANLTDADKFQKKLELWYQKQNQLAKLKAEEMEMRKELFGACFPNPVEGSGNKYELADGWIVQGDYKIERKVDEAVYNTLKSKFEKDALPLGDLIRVKLELSVSTYKTLTEAQRKQFDKCLIIKPGSPSLEVKLPKRR